MDFIEAKRSVEIHRKLRRELLMQQDDVLALYLRFPVVRLVKPARIDRATGWMTCRQN
ncbi:MAG TPA: hypothetical protein VFF81_08860 [Noviherbaspirillum sp.]|nr:hypothetical protein [Noviherbaspirillum sp.]